MKSPLVTIALTCLVVIGLCCRSARAEDVISLEDRENYQKKLFALVDADDNGRVTEKEFAVIALWDDFRSSDLTNRNCCGFATN